jgi:cysteine sulfinate desulfinase/cysteine desulfurase-like protein
MLMTDLGNDGVHVGLGSACGAMSMGPSPLIEALGLDGDANDYLRISQFGNYGADCAKLVLSKIRRYL